MAIARIGSLGATDIEQKGHKHAQTHSQTDQSVDRNKSMLHWTCLHTNVIGWVINEELARWLTDGKLVQGILFVEIVLYNDVNPYVCQPVRFAVVEF